MLRLLPMYRFAVALVAVLATGTLGYAERIKIAAPSDLTYLEAKLLEDAADGRFDTMTLLDAALVAEAIADARVRQSWEDKIRSALGVLRQRTDSTANMPCRLSAVVRTFDVLHSHLLTGKYCADCTPVSRVLTDGNYNCVSATVLFLELCRRQNIHVTAMTTNTHVFCQAQADSQPCDIQPTCADWFRLSPTERRTLGSSSASTARPIRESELVGKIYYNLGVHSLEKKHFAHADRCFRLALLLDGLDSAAEENLLATWNNWALELCDRGQYAEAASLLETGRRLRDDYAPFANNQLHITQRWAQALCGQGRFAEAIELLRNHQHLQPEAPLFVDGPAIVYRLWVDRLVRQGRGDEAIQLLDEALRHWPACRALHAERQRLANLCSPRSSTSSTPSTHHPHHP